MSLWNINAKVVDDCFNESQHTLLKDYITQSRSQSVEDFTRNFQPHMALINSIVCTYCMDNDIDPDTVELSNILHTCLPAYDQSQVAEHLYEPHHDMVEQSLITVIYYVDSDYTEHGAWVGGELALYKNLTFAEYPANTVNILPKSNRLVLFPGFVTHRVKPYFGKNPRRSILFGFRLCDKPSGSPRFI